MGGAEIAFMAHPRFSSTPLKCPDCSGFGAIFWDVDYRIFGKNTPLVAISGDFRIDHGSHASMGYSITCTKCRLIRGLASAKAAS
jgi:hypothetical protein